MSEKTQEREAFEATAPDHIWLDLGEDFDIELDARLGTTSFHDLSDVTWSEDNATGNGIKYVRVSHLSDAQKKEVEADKAFAGLLFDFMGFLTSGETRWKFSAYDDATPGVKALEQFAEKRGLSLDEPDIAGWKNTKPPAAAEAPAVPHPGSAEASAMMDSVLAEYNWPANPKNASRAGWVAATRWIAANLATPTDSAVNAGAVPSDVVADAFECARAALFVSSDRTSIRHVLDVLRDRLAALAPKADSSEPRAEPASPEDRKVYESIASNYFKDASPASAQAGEVEALAAEVATLKETVAGLVALIEQGEAPTQQQIEAAHEQIRAAFEDDDAKPQADAGVSQIKWPKGRDVARNGDMAPVGQDVLRLVLDSDNDVCMEMWHSGESAAEFQRVTIEFCNGGGGGGQSPKTRAALINLMAAMEEDNADAPHKAHRISPAPKEGEL